MSLKRSIKTVAVSGLCLTMMTIPASGMPLASDNGRPVSWVDNSRDTYERQTLMVDGKPFFFNGVQIRIDKVKDFYHYSDEQIQNLFQIARDDGFTVANAQLRWMDIQPDQFYDASETTYIRNGEYADQNFSDEKSMLSGYSDTPDEQSLTYLKFDFAELAGADWAGSKLRVWVNSAEEANSLRLYGIEDDSWDSSTMTWNSGAPNHNGYEITGEGVIDLGLTPSYDPVNKAQYYDFDVTDFINEYCDEDKKASFILRTDKDTKNMVGIDGKEGEKAAPQLVISRDDVYNWDYLDKVIGWAEEAGIKLELLWFSTDTVNSTIDNRVPYYVFQGYQKSLKTDGTPFFEKKTDPVYGTYWFLMCKNDPELRAKEKEAMKAMFDHIAEYNRENGNLNTVVGCQVANEPAVGRLHQTKYGEHCYCDTCMKKKGTMSDQEFRDLTMWEYTNNLAAGVKESDYSVWTRVNNYTGTDAVGVTYNEKMRKQGGTNVDFIGPDPYGADTQLCYDFGHKNTWLGPYDQGDNLTMIMENSGSKSGTPNWILAALAGGSFYNVYDLCSPDGNGLYDNKNGIPVPHGEYVEDMRNINHMLNKISFDLATKVADGDGGKKLVFLNQLGKSTSAEKKVRNIEVSYVSPEKGVGIVVDHGEKEIILESTRDAKYTLKGLAGYGVSSLEEGYYDEEGNWVKGTDEKAEFTISGNDVIIEIPAYSCIRLVTGSAMAPGDTFFEVESLPYNLSPDSKLDGFWWEDKGVSGKWMKVIPKGIGDWVEFDLDMPASDYEYEVIAGYRSANNRGQIQLAVNGEECGDPVDMYASGSEFTEKSFGSVKFDSDGTKKMRFTVTGKNSKSSGYVIGLDYIRLVPQVPAAERTAVVNGELPELPKTLEVMEQGKIVEKNVEWDLDPEDFKENYSVVTVNGKVEDSDVVAQAKVEVVPKNLVYFIDCNSEDSESYKAVEKLGLDLLNDRADQSWKNSDDKWGITDTYDGKKSDGDGDKFHDGYYGKNKAGKENGYAYKLTLEAGEYDITVQSHEWWNDSRSSNFEAVYEDKDGKKVSVMIAENVKVGAGNSIDALRTGRLTVDHETEVTLNIYANSEKGAVITFLGVAYANVADKTDLKLLLEKAKEEVQKTGSYTAESIEILKKAIDEAKKIMDEDQTDQESIDLRKAELQKALDALTVQDAEYYTDTIKVTKEPDKMEYVTGEKFDPAGMEVTVYETASKSNADRKRILSPEDYEVTQNRFDTAGVNEVTVTYSGKNAEGVNEDFTDSFSVRVIESEEEFYTTGIKVTKKPTKTEYEIGEDFNPEGMEVVAYETASSSNAIRREIELSPEDYDISQEEFDTAGTKMITVTYHAENKDGEGEAFSASFSVKVTEAWEDYYTTRIKVEKKPEKIVYKTGENFEPEGMKVVAYERRASSSNAERRERVLSEDEYELDIPPFDTQGAKSVKVLYCSVDQKGEEKTFRDSFTVRVLGNQTDDDNSDDDDETTYKHETTYKPDDNVTGTWQGGKNEPWRFKKSNGTYATNEWAKINGKWYHFDTESNMQTGWLSDQNKWYFLGPDGSMCADIWSMVNGKWYYFNADGSMKCNEWFFYKETWYYLGSDGEMLVSNITPDGYQVDAEGRWIG